MSNYIYLCQFFFYDELLPKAWYTQYSRATCCWCWWLVFSPDGCVWLLHHHSDLQQLLLCVLFNLELREQVGNTDVYERNRREESGRWACGNFITRGGRIMGIYSVSFRPALSPKVQFWQNHRVSAGFKPPICPTRTRTLSYTTMNSDNWTNSSLNIYPF